MAHEKFIAKLRKAKPKAVYFFREVVSDGGSANWCISDALYAVGVLSYEHLLVHPVSGKSISEYRWCSNRRRTEDDIARVFDESIRALGAEP